MNNYFTLRKANRLRVKLLTEKSQEQIREVVCYLRRISWDICGVELICSDLIDIAVQANKDGNELFSVISDAETFVQEVKPSLKRLSWFDFFTVAIPIYLFLGWGIEGVFLYPLVLSAIPDYKIEISFGFLVQFCICAVSAYYLFRHMMEHVGFPPCRHRIKCMGCLLVYVTALYTVGTLLHHMLGKYVLAYIAPWPLTIGCLVIGAFFLEVRYYWYGKDERLVGRI